MRAKKAFCGALLLVCVLLGMSGVPQEHLDQVEQTLEFLVLESGLGVRWEPSASEVRQLASALENPIQELYLNRAPYVQTGETVVTPETLAWTILAELEWAEQLKVQGEPRALVFVYLVSHQIRFAQEELLDPDRGLYHQGWRNGSSLAGEPRLRDQILMLWALSAYSRMGELLATDEAPESNAQLFRKFVSPLADRLFQAITREMVPLPDGGDLASSEMGLWFQALREYTDATLEVDFQKEANSYEEEARSVLERGLREENADGEMAHYSLATLADDLGRLDSYATLSAREIPLHDRFGKLMSAPHVQAILEAGPLWPRAVEYDTGTQKWRVIDATFQTVPAMAVVFRLMRLARSITSEIPPLSPPERDIASLIQILGRVSAQLETINAEVTPLSRASTTLPSGSSLSRSNGLELAILTAALILSLELIFLAWWRQRHEAGH